MKYLVFGIIFILFQSDYDTLMPWKPDEKLEWSDFQGEPPGNPGFMRAVTHSIVTVRHVSFEDDIPCFKVFCEFDRSKSWTLTNEKSDLEHEQLHFDISELYARMIRKKMDSLMIIKEKRVEVYRQLARDLLAKKNMRQKEYDQQAYASLDNQNEWIHKITTELKNLEKYEFIDQE